MFNILKGYFKMISENLLGMNKHLSFIEISKYIGYKASAHNFYLQALADNGILVGAF